MRQNQSVNIQARGHLAEALEVLSQLPKNENGRISWESSQLERGTFELIYSLTFKPAIDDYVKDEAVWHSLNECARANDFSTKFFTTQLRTFITKHFSKKLKLFVAITQVNARATVGLPSTLPSLTGSIEIRPTIPKAHRNLIESLEPYDRERLGLQDRFLYMMFRLRATDDRAAIDEAYRNTKFSLGLLNLVTSGFGVSKRFGLPNAPIGDFLSGSTIFNIDHAERRMGHYLSENHYPTAWKDNFVVWHRKAPAEQIRRNAKSYVSRLAKLDFENEVIRAIILFQEGLETAHVDIALLKFWTGIEVLCAREEREATERVIERASSIFLDRRHATMRLNFIQEFRNKIVHRGEVGDHSLLCAQWGSIYLAGLIRFCLFNRHKIVKRSDFLEFLSTPTDESRLLEALSRYRKRLNSLRRQAER